MEAENCKRITVRRKSTRKLNILQLHNENHIRGRKAQNWQSGNLN